MRHFPHLEKEKWAFLGDEIQEYVEYAVFVLPCFVLSSINQLFLNIDILNLQNIIVDIIVNPTLSYRKIGFLSWLIFCFFDCRNF